MLEEYHDKVCNGLTELVEAVETTGESLGARNFGINRLDSSGRAANERRTSVNGS